jgi:hypothetical protein
MLAYLPFVVGPLVTLIVVLFGVFFGNRHVDARIADVNGRIADVNGRLADVAKLITAESARLEAVIKLEIMKVEARVAKLEDRAGLIYRP